MSRNGSGVYSLPAGYEAVTGEVATATQHNTPLEDLETDMNTARPIVAGGTGATSAAAAVTSLGAVSATADQTVTGNKTFSGTTTITTADVNGGAIDGTTIGANSASTGAFTTLTASGTASFSALAATGGTASGLTSCGSAVFPAGDGTISSPAFTFSSDTDTGFYRSSSGAVVYTSNNSGVLTFNSGGIDAVSGSAAAPSYSFISNTDMGMYRRGDGDVGIATGGNDSFSVRDSASGRMFNEPSYNNTSAVAANLGILSSGGLFRSTSSLSAKTDIENADLAHSEKVVYESRPIWYRSLCKNDRKDWSHWGFGAEEIAEIDPRLVHWNIPDPEHLDKNGKPVDPGPMKAEGVAYERYVVHIVNVMQHQKKVIKDLSARLERLENRGGEA